MKVMLAQAAPKVGDIAYNTVLVIEAAREAERRACDVVVLPELVITGYPPEDLLLRAAFLDEVEAAVARVIEASGDVTVVFGHPRRHGGQLRNSATIARCGRAIGVYDKQSLPNYGVFDERRYFSPGDGSHVFEVDGWRIGVGICEDLWDDGVAASVATQPRDVLLNLNASPFHVGKQAEREALMAKRAKEFGAPVVYVNSVGGQDEVVFDGGSHVMDPAGELLARVPLFEAASPVVDLAAMREAVASVPAPIEQIRKALVLGVRDYVRHNGCSQVLLGLSGGIDSALTAAIAVEALGAENVLGVLLPSRYSSGHSLDDAEALAENLGIERIRMPIETVVAAAESLLSEPFAKWGLTETDTTEENVQARARGLLLMGLSNKTGRMLLSTGNKSEMAVGYATLYGDMAGGFAVLKDVYKTQVFELSRHLNAEGEVIPEHTITKPPSAELRPDQKDSDSLPDYAELDAILMAYIESRLNLKQIADRGFEIEEVRRVVRMLHLAEYKRRQAPPGVKITQKAFGRDRRYPITHGFREWV